MRCLKNGRTWRKGSGRRRTKAHDLRAGLSFAPSPPAPLLRGERGARKRGRREDSSFDRLSISRGRTALQSLVHAVWGPACCSLPDSSGVVAANATDASQTPAENKKAHLTVLSDDLHELKDAFNADQGFARVLLLVSPQCPVCRRGAGIVEKYATLTDQERSPQSLRGVAPPFSFDRHARRRSRGDAPGARRTQPSILGRQPGGLGKPTPK